MLHRESGMGVMDSISRSGHATVTGSEFARQRELAVTGESPGKMRRSDELEPGDLLD